MSDVHGPDRRGRERSSAIERDDAGARLAIAAELAAELAAGRLGRRLRRLPDRDRACAPAASTPTSMNQTLELTSLGDLEPGAPRQPRARPARLRPARRPHRPGPRRRDRPRSPRSREDGFARRLRVALPAELERYVVEHGSIALDGVSLTVAALDGDARRGLADPRDARAHHARRALAPGDRVNVEVDVMARYAERLLQGFADQRMELNADEPTARRQRADDRDEPRSRPSRRRSRRSAAAAWSSSATARTARTRATSSWRRSSRRPRPSTSWPPTAAG